MNGVMHSVLDLMRFTRTTCCSTFGRLDVGTLGCSRSPDQWKSFPRSRDASSVGTRRVGRLRRTSDTSTRSTSILQARGALRRRPPELEDEVHLTLTGSQSRAIVHDRLAPSRRQVDQRRLPALHPDVVECATNSPESCEPQSSRKIRAIRAGSAGKIRSNPVEPWRNRGGPGAPEQRSVSGCKSGCYSIDRRLKNPRIKGGANGTVGSLIAGAAPLGDPLATTFGERGIRKCRKCWLTAISVD
jgi:hypothetical protein